MNILKGAFALLAFGAAQAHAETLPPAYQQMAAIRVFNPASPSQIGGGGHAFGPAGSVTFAASINPDGWSAVVNIPAVTAGGTYALNPSSATPGLVFNVTRQCYNSSQVLTTCAFTVYGTSPKRFPYPASTFNQEIPLIGGMQTTVALSDDILPSDTVTVSALSGFYTDTTSHAAAAQTAVTVSNGASATTMSSVNSPSGVNGEFTPTGNWVTPAAQRWGNGQSFPVEFAAFSKFPRNGSQVKAVKFVASDGTNSVSHVATSMSLSARQLTATCTTTSGSAVLTCGSTTHFFTGERVTITPSTVNVGTLNLGSEPSITVNSSTQMTLSSNAGASDTVTVTLGAPIYDYAVNFTSTDQASLNAGKITIEAIVYPNLGVSTLDTAHAFGSASTTCTMNVGGVASPVLTSCGSIAGFNQFDHVAVTGTADGALLNNDVYLWAAPSNSSITLDVTPLTATQATVTIASGTPATAITPSLKNLTVYNDKGAVYGTLCARVLAAGSLTSGATGIGNVTSGTCSTTSGGSLSYQTIYEAAQALATANNTTTGTGHPLSTYTHFDACGSTIFVDGAVTGTGGTTSTYIPTGCAAMAIVQGDNGGTLYSPPTITAGASSDYGYSTLVNDLLLTDTSTYKTVLKGLDAASLVSGNGPKPRAAHVVLQYSEILESLSASCGPIVHEIGWMEYYSVYGNTSICTDNAITPYSVGVNYSSFGSYWLGFSTTSQAQLNTSMGNIYGAFQFQPATLGTALYMLPPSNPISAFDKIMNYSSTIFNWDFASVVSYPVIRNNLTIAQDVFECTGTASTTTCVNMAGDGDKYALNNFLMESATIIGNRLNYDYNSVGAYSVPKTANVLYSAVRNWNSKSDTFVDPTDYAITALTSAYTVSGATGCTGTVDTLTFPTPGADAPSFVNGYNAGGLAQTGTVTISGGTIASSGAVSLGSYSVNNVSTPLGTGYANASIVATVGDAGCPSATVTFTSASLSGVGYNRTGNWRSRYSAGYIGNVTGVTSNSLNPSPISWYGDFFGLQGNPTTVGYGAMTAAFYNNASNSSTDGAGSNTGFGWYKPTSSTGFANRVPAGFAPFPGDIEGTARKNDGTGCAGAYEC